MVSVPFCSQIFVPGWFVLRPLRWCSTVASCSSAFSGLAAPFYFSSPALSLLCPWGALLFGFPPTRLWSSRLAFRSVTVPLVFSWLLLVCSYLLSPVGLWVLQGLNVLACPCIRGCSSQGIFVLCLRLSRFGFLPCFLSCSSGVFCPGGCFPLGGLLLYGRIGSLIPRSSAVVLLSVVCLQSSFPTLVVVLFIPPSSFRTPSVSVGCVPSAFKMGSP